MSVAREKTPGIDTSRCKASILARSLNDLDLLAHRYPGEVPRDDWPMEMLRDRDADRVRLYLRIASEPAGISLPALVSQVIKGIRYKDQCTLPDGSDADYQFTRRFVEDLRQEGHVETLRTGANGARVVQPTPDAIDLISAGIRETGASDGPLYDREFCERILRSVDGLDDGQKQYLERSLRRYIDRVDDYRLLFDVTTPDRSDFKKRMTKGYKTRFNSAARYGRSFARLQDALEEAFERSETAVLCTLTTWPQLHESLADQIDNINPNYHRLTQYLSSDPETKADTRKDGVVAWSQATADAVTGRPRESLDYIKVLEFTSDGKPHLHVLFFDPPRRESDGMPWLIDKAELSQKWLDYGQAKVVDMYPLTYRDDLDDLEGVEFNKDEGFVCWYRYGDHEHGEEWARERSRSHDLVDMAGDDEQLMQKTAGQYLGKYLSMLYGALMADDPEEATEGSDDKAAWWKLAMYWATERQFWSISRSLEEAIDRDTTDLDHRERAAVRWCVRHDIHMAIARVDAPDAPLSDLPVETDPDDKVIHDAATVAEELVHIEYLGAYHVADLPSRSTCAPSIEPLEEANHDRGSGITIGSRADRPPPRLADRLADAGAERRRSTERRS